MSKANSSLRSLHRPPHWMCVVVLLWAAPIFAGAAASPQADERASHGHGTSPGQTEDQGSVADQLAALQAKVAVLEAALKRGHQAAASASQPKAGTADQGRSMMAGGERGMRGMSGQGEAANDSMPGMSMMGGPGMNMPMDESMMGSTNEMPPMERGKGMMPGRRMGMGMMGNMSGMQMPSAQPGIPGTSHLLHVGSTDFFLDHAGHIKLSLPQQRDLSQIKEKALLENANVQRKIDQAEQDLWSLTGSENPDPREIEAKVAELAKLRADQRLAFIQAVNRAAKILSDEQRQTLLGTMPSQ